MKNKVTLQVMYQRLQYNNFFFLDEDSSTTIFFQLLSFSCFLM